MLPEILCITPFERPSVTLVRAISRTNAFAILDIGNDERVAIDVIREAHVCVRAPFGVRMPIALAHVPLPDAVHCVVLDRPHPVELVRAAGRVVLTQVCSAEEALQASAFGSDGLIVKGMESGGRVGMETSFVLLQRLIDRIELPLWVQGGIGLRTAAAVRAIGARGIVLDSQLALTPEAATPVWIRHRLATMDGSEPRVQAGVRAIRPPASASSAAALHNTDRTSSPLIVGQEGAFARELADAYASCDRVVLAFEQSMLACVDQARQLRPIAPGAGVAATHGMSYPIVQGPMTRVSDRAEFAAAVAAGGGLPMLALALLRADSVRALLERTADLLGDAPWGVGILGFAPEQIRQEQLDVVRDVRPKVALVAGARKAVVEQLRQTGITTYVHVPSPIILDQFLRDGFRHFILEGSECGGHIGPRTSFTLWEQAVARLSRESSLKGVHVLFAGGIHDARSAAAAAVISAPLCARGARVGVLSGTAYLFTREAVTTGAIVETYQQQVLAAEQTIVLEAGPGQAIRALDSEYSRVFDGERRRLERAGLTMPAIAAALEEFHLGRLRMATKGLRRDGESLETLSEDEQRTQGLFMSGQVAGLRAATTTIAELHRDVSEGATRRIGESTAPRARRRQLAPEIAIVGMAALFPHADDLQEYWAQVLLGSSCIDEVPNARWRHELHLGDDAPGERSASKWGGFVRAQRFDPLELGIPPRALAAIDPAQLLTLLTVRKALADARLALDTMDTSRISVIIGAEASIDVAAQYMMRAFLPSLIGRLPAELEARLARFSEDSFPGVLGNLIAGRVSNRLDLRGSNYTVNAACASSLAALECACRELYAGSSDVVVTGGVDMHNSIYDYLMFSSVHALSKDGECKPFDASANGIALSEGVGIVVLKRLEDALANGDRIYAKICAVAGGSDGKSQSLTAPSFDGQLRALRSAYHAAGLSAADVELIEAHGTGTVVGDRTELEALTQLMHESGAAARRCALGSVKSQIGHTKCAAGMAGLIKAALAVHHGVLPPTRNIEHPNASYDPDTSPFSFHTEPRPWVSTTRRAGVSAFGFGGTNFHAVLEGVGEAATLEPGAWPTQLFVFRGETEHEAIACARALAPWLSDIEDGPALADLAAAVADQRRGNAKAQFAIVADSRADLARAIGALDQSARDIPGVYRRRPELTEGRVAFVFPGQGSQRAGMLREIFCAFPEARAWLPSIGDWVDALFPSLESRSQLTLQDTRVAQPLLGACDLAMADVLATYGVVADMSAGHSYGELAALCCAGVLPRAELIALSRSRAEVMLAAFGSEPGAMSALSASSDAVAELLLGLGDVWLANVNSPHQSVIAGCASAVGRALARAEAGGIRARRLPVPYAFHTPRVEAAVPAYASVLDAVDFGRAAHPVWSNWTAERYPEDDTEIRRVLSRQLAAPVQFERQIRSMYEAGARIFVEVGPGEILTNLVRTTLGDSPHLAVASDRPRRNGLRALLEALAAMVVAGVDLDERGSVRSIARAQLDLSSPPPKRAGVRWIADGRTVWNASEPAPMPFGTPLKAGVSALATVDAREDTVKQYLQRVGELVEAQRDVMLAYLGAPARAAGHVEGRRASEAAAPPTSPSNAVPASGQGANLDVSPQELLTRLLSERTGYPNDMLTPEADLEADLGVDSIKRTEVLHAFAESLALGHDAGQDDLVERLLQQRTIASIMDTLREIAPSTRPAPTPNGGADQNDTAERIERLVPQCVELDPAAPARGDFKRVVVAPAKLPLASQIVTYLEQRGVTAVAADMPALLDRETDALICLFDFVDAAQDPAKDVFAWCRAALAHRVRSVAAVTARGGRFGLDTSAAASRGGTAGLIKSLAKEHPQVCFKIIDVDSREEHAAIAAGVVEELYTPDDVVEIGRSGPTRVSVRPIVEPRAKLEITRVDRDSVLLIIGGLRGIAGRIAAHLHERFGCALELAGRSDMREAAACEGLGDLSDAAQARRALLAASASPVSAPQLEHTRRTLQAVQEASRTMSGLRAAGARADYHVLDVRNREELAAVIERVYARHGRLDGIIHAAGVLEDGLALGKSEDSFARVYDTKVIGARNILSLLRPDTRFVVFFSSVAATYGNRGQADYAAANDCLDTIARTRADGARVRSIAWGPWSSVGMVTDDLERMYRKRGIGLIPPDLGAREFIDELVYGDAPHVILAAGPAGLT